MSGSWHYMKDGKRHGPVAAAELGRLVASGSLPRVVFVPLDGKKDWASADTVPELLQHIGAPAPAPAPRPSAGKGAVLLDDDLAGFAAAAPAAPAKSGATRPVAPAAAVPTGVLRPRSP